MAVVTAVAGAGWPVVAANVALALALPAGVLDLFFFFFLGLGYFVGHNLLVKHSLGGGVDQQQHSKLTSCQAQTGLKLSTTLTSSHRFGNNQKPGDSTK